MKTIVTIIVALFAGSAPGFAQWAVFDIPNLTQSILNYAALTEQIAKQATQIANQVEQIKQFETQLDRMGDMASIRSLVGFPEFKVDLELPTKVKTWADELARVDGAGLFGDNRGGIYREITPEFSDFDGTGVPRDPRVFKSAHDMVVAVDEFKTVQNDVYTRREDLKRAIIRTSEAVQAADTEAEQMKLESVLNAQYGQLAAIDTEVALSAAQVQVKAAESVAMTNAREEADAEARRHLAQQEVRKLSVTFKPRYENLLQYVTETRMP
jgi:conjugal transfer/entry exclusion protein